MTDADNRMNPLHFGSDPADVGIWITIHKSIESRITFGWHFGLGGGLRSLSTV